jgi:hypothetical protein
MACTYNHPPLIDVNWFRETSSIEIRPRLTNPISAFAILFIIRTIITLILFQILKNVMKNSEHW